MIFNRLVVLGVGLMGGSLALALKKAGVVGTVVGWSRRQSTLDSALNKGVIDLAEPDLETALRGADCVVVATPTILAESLLVKVLEFVPSSVAVTDVASVKGNIVNALSEHFGKVPSNAILGHPIAGSEQSGVAAAKDDLFQNHRVILISDADTDSRALEQVRSMWVAAEAEVFEMSAPEHDRVLALSSHLPHILAYALVTQLSSGTDSADAFKFAAGGFRDFTRIASSDPRMWREILLANKEQVSASLDGFEQQLKKIRSLLHNNDGESIEVIFTEAKGARDEFAEQLALRSKKKW